MPLEKITDPNVLAGIKPVNAQTSYGGPSEETVDRAIDLLSPTFNKEGLVKVTDPNHLADHNRFVSEVNDDQWYTPFQDAWHLAKGLGYGVGDEAAWLAGGKEASQEYRFREEIARARSPFASIAGEIAAGIATDIGIYAAGGAIAGSVVPGAGTAVGGVGGAVVGAARGIYRAGSVINKALQASKAGRLANKSLQYGGIGAAHGYGYGFGSAEGGFGDRHAGGVQEAKYGALFGGVIPGGAAALRGGARTIGRVGNYAAGRTGTLVRNTPALQRANAQAMANGLYETSRHLVPTHNKSQFTAVMTNLTGEAQEAAAVMARQQYSALDNAQIGVNLTDWQKQALQLAEHYSAIGGGGQAARQLRELAKGASGVKLDDARYIREGIYDMRHVLKPKDFDKLHKSITGAMKAGAEAKGAGSLFTQADEFYKQMSKDMKSEMFKLGLKEGGFKDAIVRQAVVGENRGKYLNAIRDHLDMLEKYGQDTSELRRDVAGLAIKELVGKGDFKKLRELTSNTPDNGQYYLTQLLGKENKELIDTFTEISKLEADAFKSAKAPKILPEGGVGSVTAAGIGFFSPEALMAGLAIQFGKRQLHNSLQHPAVQRAVRKYVYLGKQKNVSPNKVVEAENNIKSEISAALATGVGLYAYDPLAPSDVDNQ